MDLNRVPEIAKLAKELGCEFADKPFEAILDYCRRRVRSLLQDYPVATLTELLDVVAAHVDTKFVEVHNNQELREIRNYFFKRGENGFARLNEELGPKALAITFRRLRPGKGEPTYISVVDARGEKLFRVYFSKYHEVAHLLTLTDPNRLKFCRTHEAVDYALPEEVLMEEIAAELGFFPDIVERYAEGPICFQKIRALRDRLCNNASWYSAVVNLSKRWPTPCVLIEVGPDQANRMAQERSGALISKESNPIALRVVRSTPSSTPHALGKIVRSDIQITKNSIIHQVFADSSTKETTADENLKGWIDGSGRRLPNLPIRIHVKKDKHRLWALLIPIDTLQ